MATTLASLSDEVLLMIIECIVSPPDTHLHPFDRPCMKTLRNLSLCSRRFNNLSQPSLYAILQETNHARTPLVKLLCKILDVPSRSFHVKTLSITTAARLDMSALTPEDWAKIKGDVKNMVTSSKDALAWYRSMMARKWDAVVAFILSRLPNLERLNLHWLTYGKTLPKSFPWFARFLTRVAILQDLGDPPPYALPKLQTISLDSDSKTFFITPQKSIEFLKIKSVNTFRSTSLAIGDDFHWEADSVEFKTSRLHLGTFHIGSQPFVKFLRHFTQLKDLHYTYQKEAQNANAELFMLALSSHQSTLEHLTILKDKGLPGNIPFVLGSLAGFEKLRSLTIMAWAFSNSGELPRSLESLELKHPRTETLGKISLVLKDKKTHTPSLKFLEIGWGRTIFPDKPSPEEPDRHNGFTTEQAHAFWDECRLAGVEMGLTHHKPKMKYVSWPRPKNATVVTWPVVWVDKQQVVVRFDYPWEGYEDCLTEHGYDETYHYDIENSSVPRSARR